MPAQNSPNETSDAEAQATRTQQRIQETAKPGQADMEAIEATRSSDPSRTNTKLTGGMQRNSPTTTTT